ncbi:MAG: PmoA family protein [Proteobacteria bacterium]|nr:PmoA family protein [Pseudomonadota bacterium]
MAGDFTLTDDSLVLPPGAIARTHRQILRHRGRPVLGLTQGRMRPYVFPLFTPAGYAVSSESPADHPHHNSLWIASDHVHARMPVGDGRYEEYTYNFYVDETFQGRAPGTLVAQPVRLSTGPDGEAVIVQTVEWRGPAEWGAGGGRAVAREERRLTIRAARAGHVVDVDSTLHTDGWDIAVGPTRHAYFNVRVADAMVVSLGGTVRDDRGKVGGEAISGAGANWVDFSGPVGGGHIAGVTVFPDPRDHPEASWFVADWGVVSVGAFRQRQHLIRKGEPIRARYRVIAHDGAAADAEIRRWHAVFLAGA